jgi:Lrp/AsnC family leucine-responsive transcriptional regulator
VKRLKYENGKIDTVDEKLLKALTANARTTNAELARLVGLSAPSVAERVKRLEEAGVIKGCTLVIDPEAIGLPISAWLRIRPMPGQLPKVVEVVHSLPEIVERDRVTGEDCFLARVHMRSMQELERVIDQIIPYAMTNMSIIQSSPVERRLPPLVSTDAASRP